MKKVIKCVIILGLCVIFGVIYAEIFNSNKIAGTLTPREIEVTTEAAAPELRTGYWNYGGIKPALPLPEPKTEKVVAPEAKPRISENGSYLGKFWVTAYCGCYECSEGWGNMTSTGVYARPNHTIAVDPRVLPYGTRVVINGITYTAEDCGGGVKGNHIDIYFAEHWQTLAFNTGYKDVYRAK